MPREYTQEELWELYEKLPKELKEVVFAGETAEHISSTCGRFSINEKTIREVAKYVRNVLLGLLTPEDFQRVLEEDLKLEKETARNLSQEIDRFIFYPVKPALEQLYGAEKTEEKKTTEEVIIEQPKKNTGQDKYREPIE
jgi:hypothetical protein